MGYAADDDEVAGVECGLAERSKREEGYRGAEDDEADKNLSIVSALSVGAAKIC